MRRVYVDAAHYVAMLFPSDDLHERAAGLRESLRRDRLVTSDPVLVEVLAYVSGRGRRLRAAAIELVDTVRADPSTDIARQTPALFDEGLELYRRRADKAYSLTDCMSMVVCHDQDIKEVLTHDRHFQQEGFTILL